MIPDSIVALLQTGVSVMVGTRDASLMPECTRAWGIHIAAEGRTVTIFLSKAIAGKTIENLRENGKIASDVHATYGPHHLPAERSGPEHQAGHVR